MGKSNKNNKSKDKVNIQVKKNDISAQEIELAIINANNRISENEKNEMSGIISWTKEVLWILGAILVLLFIAFIIAFGRPMLMNLANGKIFEPVNLFLCCYIIASVYFIIHIFKIKKETEKIKDISTITNLATLLLSIIALIIAILALFAQVEL